MQYYNRLIRLLMTGSLMTGPLSYHTHKLYSCVRDHIMTSHHWIVEYFDLTKGKGHFDMELLLAIIAMELHCGRTSSFYEMLKFMNSFKLDFQLLVIEIQGKVDTVKSDSHESSGMYASINLCILIHDHQSHVLRVCVMYCIGT